MSEQTAPDVQPDNTPVDTTAETPASPPVSDAVMSRLDELAASVARIAPQEAEPQHGFTDLVNQPYDPFQGADEFGFEEDPNLAAQPNELQQLNDLIAQQVQQHLGPLQQRLTQTQANWQADQLQQKYPDLGKPEVVSGLMNELDTLASSLSQSGMPAQQVHQILRHPALVEKLYLAQRANTAAAQETPADANNTVQLEGAAAQVEAPQQNDIMANILNSGPQPGSFKW